VEALAEGCKPAGLIPVHETFVRAFEHLPDKLASRAIRDAMGQDLNLRFR
jgi:hypothetical protein